MPRLALPFFALLSPVAAQLDVASVTPDRNVLAAPTNPSIELDFVQALDPLTVSTSSFQVFGRWSGVMTGSISVENADHTIVFSPDRPFFAGEYVTVMASAAIQSSAGSPLQGGHNWGFWTRCAPGSYTFTTTETFTTRFPGEPRIRSYGAYAGDIDRDGTPDLTIPNEDSDDVRILYGDGCTSFGLPQAHHLPVGSVPSPNEGADFNGDGWIDFVTANIAGDSVAVFLNDGAGSFLPVTVMPSGNNTRGVCVLDVEGDGDVDIISANHGSSNLAMFLNDGTGSFSPAVTFSGGASRERGIACADANDDGWLDLWVADFNGGLSLMLSNGAGGFSQSAYVNLPNGCWMITLGDVNGDGNVDAAIVNAGASNASIVFGDGAGGLSAPTNYSVGSFPLAVDLGDLDGDGDLELVTSSFSASVYTVFRNNGSGVFQSPFTRSTPGAASCAIIVDFDRDGDNDLVGIDELDDLVHLYRQDGPLPLLVQTPNCDATLRVDSFANRGGFGLAPPHPAPRGHSLHLGVTGSPSATYVTLFGSRVEPGIFTPFGFVNVNVATSLPPGTLNAHGEDLITLGLPGTLGIGQRFSFQSVVLTSATPLTLLLSNPEEIEIE